jgi:hypothetical protein
MTSEDAWKIVNDALAALAIAEANKGGFETYLTPENTAKFREAVEVLIGNGQDGGFASRSEPVIDVLRRLLGKSDCPDWFTLLLAEDILKKVGLEVDDSSITDLARALLQVVRTGEYGNYYNLRWGHNCPPDLVVQAVGLVSPGTNCDSITREVVDGLITGYNGKNQEEKMAAENAKWRADGERVRPMTTMILSTLCGLDRSEVYSYFLRLGASRDVAGHASRQLYHHDRVEKVHRDHLHMTITPSDTSKSDRRRESRPDGEFNWTFWGEAISVAWSRQPNVLAGWGINMGTRGLEASSRAVLNRDQQLKVYQIYHMEGAEEEPIPEALPDHLGVDKLPIGYRQRYLRQGQTGCQQVSPQLREQWDSWNWNIYHSIEVAEAIKVAAFANVRAASHVASQQRAHDAYKVWMEMIPKSSPAFRREYPWITEKGGGRLYVPKNGKLFEKDLEKLHEDVMDGPIPTSLKDEDGHVPTLKIGPIFHKARGWTDSHPSKGLWIAARWDVTGRPKRKSRSGAAAEAPSPKKNKTAASAAASESRSAQDSSSSIKGFFPPVQRTPAPASLPARPSSSSLPTQGNVVALTEEIIDLTNY